MILSSIIPFVSTVNAEDKIDHLDSITITTSETDVNTNPIAVTNDLYIGADNNIYFVIRNLKSNDTSDLHYQVIGFTITKCTVGDKNPLEDIYVPVLLGPYTETLDGNKYVSTIYKIDRDEILSRIGQRDPEWLKDINSGLTCYLKFDAVIVTVKDGIVSGSMDEKGNLYINTEAEKPGIYNKNTIEELKNVYEWDSVESIDSLFDKYLLFLGEEEETITNYHTGVNNAYFKTGNTSDLFDLSKSIPTSEDVTNKIECDKWFGSMSVAEIKKKKSYTFPYILKWNEWDPYASYDSTTGTYTGAWVQQQVYKSITVKKEAKFYTLNGIDIYAFDGADIYNGTYPTGSISYSGVDVPVSFGVNGIDNPLNVPKWDYLERMHIKWGTYSGGTKVIDAGNTSYATAYAMAYQDANNDDKAGLTKTEARNDYVVVDGITFMDGRWVELTKANDYHTPAYANFPTFGNYPRYSAEKTVTIPSSVANSTYLTHLTATYRRITLEGDDYKIIANSIIPDSVIEEYKQNEPIRVHTPVISPIRVIDAEPETQLITPVEDSYIDGQLILDNYYTFHWDEAMHRDILGYGSSGDPSKYDKYVAKKEMRFPFDVYYKGQYMKAGAWILIEKDDWQNTTVYIPPFAEEMNGLIDYRVTAENIYDETGEEVTERISKKENLANVTVSIDGSGENYVATYSISAQTSGILYGFEIDGINNKDAYTKNATSSMSDLQNYSLAQNKEELKVGTRNRIGENSVRYTVDNSVTTSWDKSNTLPLGIDEENKPTEVGSGFKFSFQLKSIGNLGDNENDAIYIIPSYRYVKPDGTVLESDEFNLYYSDDNGLFTKYMGTIDQKNIHTVQLKDDLFCGSVFDYGDGSSINNLHNNELLYTAQNDDTLSLSNKTMTEFLSTKVDSYSLCRIQLTNKLRVLDGNYGYIKNSLTGEGNLGKTDNYNLLSQVDKEHNELVYNKFVKSMQTWHGEYEIPDDLYICDSSINLEEYATNHDLTEDSDIWYNNGYLILNFYIYSKNDNHDHLQYYPKTSNYGSSNMWRTEGGRNEMNINGSNIDLRDGDIVVISMDKMKKNKNHYTNSIFMIN